MDDWQQNPHQHYALVAKAIMFIRQHALRQPTLQQIADHVGLSEYHFQRIFTQWAGISPKRFLQFLTKEHAKQALQRSMDVLDASLEVGLSTPSRLHDLTITCEAMTPGEIKSLGAGVGIEYGLAETPFGHAVIGSTVRGVCYFAFCESAEDFSHADIQAHWVNATLSRNDVAAQRIARQIFAETPEPGRLHLVLKGTNFQIKVWEALMQIRPGQIHSYSQLAALAGCKGAQRAVGTALAANIVGYLIPCHRVIRESGDIGNYRWGQTRKAALLAWEAAAAEPPGN